MELNIQVLELSLELGYFTCEVDQDRLLYLQVVGIFLHLGLEGYVGVSEVGN